MCMSCSDSIDSCEDCCGWNRSDGYRKSYIYSLGDKYCAALAEKHGHSEAIWNDRWECDWCEAEAGTHKAYNDCPKYPYAD